MIRHVLAAALFLSALAPLVAGGPELTPGTLSKWRRHLTPTSEEWAFREIPWRASFGSAVDEAREKGMPVLLWAMNGHPLGCT